MSGGQIVQKGSRGILFLRVRNVKLSKDALIYSSPRRKPGSSSLFFLDSRVRGNDIFGFNQRLPNLFGLCFGRFGLPRERIEESACAEKILLAV